MFRDDRSDRNRAGVGALRLNPKEPFASAATAKEQKWLCQKRRREATPEVTVGATNSRASSEPARRGAEPKRDETKESASGHYGGRGVRGLRRLLLRRVDRSMILHFPFLDLRARLLDGDVPDPCQALRSALTGFFRLRPAAGKSLAHGCDGGGAQHLGIRAAGRVLDLPFDRSEWIAGVIGDVIRTGTALSATSAAVRPRPPTALLTELKAPPTRLPTAVVRRYSTTNVVAAQVVTPWSPPVDFTGRPDNCWRNSHR